MPSNFTPNYNLNQWEADDRVLRVDFNADNAKLDAALKAREDGQAALQTAVTALQAALPKKQDAASAVKFTCGTYDGDGAESRTISVGFTPKAVYVCTNYGDAGSGTSGNNTKGGLAVTGSPLTFNWNSEVQAAMEIVSGGFRVAYRYINSGYSILMNTKNTKYNYIAIG